MPKKLKKIPASFYHTEAGAEPVRDWLKALGEGDRRLVTTLLPLNSDGRSECRYADRWEADCGK